MDTNYKTLLKKVKAFVFDVDGVLTDSSVLVTTSGELLRSMSIRDGFAIKTAATAGFPIGIITGGKNPGAKSRLEALGVTAVYLGAENKMEAFEDFLNKNDLDKKAILYMGDDIPDLKVMKKVGMATCPQDAAPEVKEICQYVSHRNGGDGCVRDVIEQVLKVHGKWPA